MAGMQGSHPLSRRVLLGAGIGGAGAVATGCSVFDSGNGGGGGGGGGTAGPAITIASTSGIDSLDPHYVNSSMYILPAGLMEGLVMADEEGTDVVPALAESWDVSEDELSYTFHMREGATWSNGDPVTSADAVWSFQRLLTPTGASSGYTTGASSYLPSMRIRGASDFQAGALESWDDVGVSAPDDATVIIELAAPNPDFLLNMSHYSMTVLHQATVEGEADWQQPENWVGNGPYLLKSWDPTTLIAMEANPEYWDADNVQVQWIDHQLGGDQPTQVLTFQSGELDIVGVSGESLAGAPELKEKVKRVDGYSVFYLQSMWGGHEAIQNQKVRRAVSMAIDREALAAADPGITPGGSLVPDSVPGWSEDLVTPFDPDGARALLEEAGVSGDLPGLRIQAGWDSPMLEILAEGLIDALGLEVTIDALEAGVHADTRWKPAEDASFMSFYFGSFGGVSTLPNWTLNIFGPDHVRQFSMPYEAWEELQAVRADEGVTGAELSAQVEEILSTQSTDDAQQFTSMVNDAMAILDEDERTAAFLEAAKLREEMAFTIPLAWGSQMWATSDRMGGLHPRSSPEGYYFKNLTVSE